MVSNNDSEHHLEFAADLANLALLAEFVEQKGQDLGFSEEVRRAFELASDEAVTNVISYAYQGMEPGMVRVVLRRQGPKALMIIEDQGRPFEPASGKEPDLEASLEEREIGGLGLFFIEEMSDEVVWERLGDTNRLTMVRNKA